jgi:hypothetical protein
MNRANLFKEGIYYTLGILLIFGFVYLYWATLWMLQDLPLPFDILWAIGE